MLAVLFADAILSIATKDFMKMFIFVSILPKKTHTLIFDNIREG